MKNMYSYKENKLYIGEKELICKEKIVEIIEFEEQLVIRIKYTNHNPTNNVFAIDFFGNIIWEIDCVVKPLKSQTIVSIGKKNDKQISVVAFIGLNFIIDVISGEVVEKVITK